jgi:hypothetical protein
MLITRTSMVTGIERTKDLPVTDQQLLLYTSGKKLIQDAFPDLNESQREFMMTGITDDEWNQVMSDDEDTYEDEYGESWDSTDLHTQL